MEQNNNNNNKRPVGYYLLSEMDGFLVGAFSVFFNLEGWPAIIDFITQSVHIQTK